MKKFLTFVLILFLSFQAYSSPVLNINELILDGKNNITWEINGSTQIELASIEALNLTQLTSYAEFLYDDNDKLIEHSIGEAVISQTFITLLNSPNRYRLPGGGGTEVLYFNGIQSSWAHLPNGEDTFLGFRFINNQNWHYGYAKVNLSWNNTSFMNFTIKEFAYENVAGISIVIQDSEAILAGLPPLSVPVPEPSTSSLALLALGASGLRRLRKNKA